MVPPGGLINGDIFLRDLQFGCQSLKLQVTIIFLSVFKCQMRSATDSIATRAPFFYLFF